MTLSWPSFLAAATSASMPPRSAAPVAVAAPLPDEAAESFFSGGEHAAMATTVPAARVMARVRPRVVRTFPVLLLRAPIRCTLKVDHEQPWWRQGVQQASRSDTDLN
jgi:hypothetical protein